MDAFVEAFALTVAAEGELSTDPRDRGNWTGGKCGVGLLRGTKYGISAAAYPTLEIRALTLEDARAIYRRDYWAAASCDRLPPALALALFDFAVNSGVPAAVRGLQRALGVADDGRLGPQSLAAVQRQAAEPDELLDRLHAERLLVMAAASTWSEYGRGWARRVLRLHRRTAAEL